MKPIKRILRLLVDLAVPVLIIGAFVAVYRLGVMPLLERLLPLSDTQTSVLRRTGVTASLFFGFWVVARYYERRSITELAFRPRPMLIGAISGGMLIGITILLLFALDNYQLLSFRGFSAAMPYLVVITIGVVFEEVLFRGVMFRILERHAGTVRALGVQAFIFGVLHLFNQGIGVMTIVSVTLLGVFWTLIYVYTRNLWASIANHAVWNITIFVSGLPLSGNEEWRLSAPFESTHQGPVWLTGGGFGPEDSIINVLLLVCVVGVLAVRTWRRGQFVAGSWMASDVPPSQG